MTDRDDHPHLRLVRAYFSALEQSPDEATLSSFFVADVTQREFPNRLLEGGALRGLPELLEGARRGQKVVQNQRYQIQNVLIDGDRVALELRWTAELRVSLGKLAAGDTMTAHCGVFLRLRDGRIAEQHNFDCFESF